MVYKITEILSATVSDIIGGLVTLGGHVIVKLLPVVSIIIKMDLYFDVVTEMSSCISMSRSRSIWDGLNWSPATIILIGFGILWSIGFLNQPYYDVGTTQLVINITVQFVTFGLMCGGFLLAVRFYNKRKSKQKLEA